MDFEHFKKIPRLNRQVVITEKIDGTNAQIAISNDLSEIKAGSRNRWITVEDDNHGFAKWVEENKGELIKLGPGRHYGEWWGSGIQRGYGLSKGDKRFSLFNTERWNNNNIPACCSVVPIITTGNMLDINILQIIEDLKVNGSLAAPGFMKPEGVITYHTAAGAYFKTLIENDETHKGLL
jgi:hypothetical protein